MRPCPQSSVGGRSYGKGLGYEIIILMHGISAFTNMPTGIWLPALWNEDTYKISSSRKNASLDTKQDGVLVLFFQDPE